MKKICNGALFLAKLHNWTCNLLNIVFHCRCFLVNITTFLRKVFLLLCKPTLDFCIIPLENIRTCSFHTKGDYFFHFLNLCCILSVRPKQCDPRNFTRMRLQHSLLSLVDSSCIFYIQKTLIADLKKLN